MEETGLASGPPALKSWTEPQKDAALSTLADLIASTIDDSNVSSTEVRRALDAEELNDDWRASILEAEVEKLQQAQSRRSSLAVSDTTQTRVPTVPWQCPVCAAPQQVADARKLLRDRKHATDGQPTLPCAPTCKKCGFSMQADA